ncbi:LPXTG-site transpeptidase (sortase) family protein [Kribbella orskensis]|uniref:LPXTG-site transpeptidase (Sortase) family protein n=1 Tax=Kribbella orskensis TaxID=2512216 RepID=A0ABY2BPM3_9ACTN|nr:LPXTG-site transpeptidase (sortase) family protein [Kribbella sp. VKM Ac-2500]TCO24448.1 LPXTG-site transpeptidase (sortase) family protein [Kribbella orskensis]
MLGLLLFCVVLEGCATQNSGAVSSPGADGGTPAPVESASVSPSVQPGRVGTPAASQRIRFVPTEVVLPGGSHAPVLPASTVDGQLVVPERVQRVGWWDGGAEAGDPFGSVVLAGHVDSATDGIGYFARLLKVKAGEVVVLRGDGHSASYRVNSVVSVPKNALATESGAFDQTGDHRLVLITCTGAYDRARGGYEQNLVVSAEPIGLAR